MNPTPPLPAQTTIRRRNATTLKLLLIALLVLLFQAPLQFVNVLQKERRANLASGRQAWGEGGGTETPIRGRTDAAAVAAAVNEAAAVFEPYRLVERALKHNVLVLVLVFAAFFLFETVAAVRLHAVHYGLVGAALCLFFLALLALGEVIAPGLAYLGAAVASSALVTCYSAAILHGPARAAVIGTLLAVVHGILYVVLRMENFALLAGTATLFAALAAVMYFTRNVDWPARDAGTEAAR